MQVNKGILLIWAIGKLRLHFVFKFDSVFSYNRCQGERQVFQHFCGGVLHLYILILAFFKMINNHEQNYCGLHFDQENISVAGMRKTNNTSD